MVGAQLDVAFTIGGSPVLIETKGDQFSATFVIATTDFDSGTPDASDVQRAKSESRQPTTTYKSASRTATAATAARTSVSTNANAIAGPSNVRAGQSNAEKRTLFNPPSPSQGDRDLGGHDEFQFNDDDEFGADLELGEEDLAAIDRLSQMPPAGAGAGSQRVLAPATRSSRATGGRRDDEAGEGDGGAIDEEDEDDEEGAGADGLPTQVGPTPKSPRLAKKVRSLPLRLSLYHHS